MRLITGLALLFTTIPGLAQTDPSWNNRDAFEAYRDALKSNEKTSTCHLHAVYAELEYLEWYSEEHTRALGKLGIRPESVGVLRERVASWLVKGLVAWLEHSGPPAEQCPICICTDRISDDGIISLPRTYYVANLARQVLWNNPSVGTEAMRLKVQEHWRKSVVAESSQLKEKCLGEVEKYTISQACRVLVKALEMGIKPLELGLDPVVALKLLKRVDTQSRITTLPIR